MIGRDRCSGPADTIERRMDQWCAQSSEDQIQQSTNPTLTQDNQLSTEGILEAQLPMNHTPEPFEVLHEEPMVIFDRTQKFNDNYQYTRTKECRLSNAKVCRRLRICGELPHHTMASPCNPMSVKQSTTLNQDAQHATGFPMEDKWRTENESLTPTSSIIDLPYRNLACSSLSTSPPSINYNFLTRTPSRIPIRRWKVINHAKPKQIGDAEQIPLAPVCHSGLPSATFTSAYNIYEQSSCPNLPRIHQSQRSGSEVSCSRTLPSRTKRKRLSEEPLRIWYLRKCYLANLNAAYEENNISSDPDENNDAEDVGSFI